MSQGVTQVLSSVALRGNELDQGRAIPVPGNVEPVATVLHFPAMNVPATHRLLNARLKSLATGMRGVEKVSRGSIKGTTGVNRRHGIGAWLGIFAMLMIFIGPLISQGASMAHGMGAPMAHDMACEDMPGMAQVSKPGSPGGHHDLVIWEKCGYCTLLFQHPPLTESNLTFATPGIAPELFLATSFTPQQVSAPVFPGARSRAPPSFSR
ncbi:MAG TPA: DUF2946 domain-containing protein [Pseudomonas sp.]|jgi:hypothetical protein